MKRTKSKIVTSFFLQIYILRNNVHNIISRSYFLYYFLRIIHLDSFLLVTVHAVCKQ